MLSISVASVLNDVRVFLNDTNQTYFNNTVLAGPFRIAYRDLRDELFDNQIRVTGETSEAIEITTSMRDIGGPTGPALPTNFVVPVLLWERESGSDADYFLMNEVRTLPKSSVLTAYLQWWTYQNQIIKFLGATTDRQVKIDYIANTLGFPEAPEDRLNVFNCASFLAYRTAGLAAEFQGENAERAASLNANAQGAIDKLINLDVKNQQSMPVRRRPFMANYKRSGGNWPI